MGLVPFTLFPCHLLGGDVTDPDAITSVLLAMVAHVFGLAVSTFGWVGPGVVGCCGCGPAVSALSGGTDASDPDATGPGVVVSVDVAACCCD